MSYKPNKGMQEEAERAIRWVEEGRKGGTRIGKIRARQIARGENLSEDTVKTLKDSSLVKMGIHRLEE